MEYATYEEGRTCGDVVKINALEMARFARAFDARERYGVTVVDEGTGLSWSVTADPVFLKTDPEQHGWRICAEEETGEVSLNGEFHGVLWDEPRARSVIVEALQEVLDEIVTD